MAKLPVSKNLRFLPQERAEPAANWKNAPEYSYRILDRARAASTENFNQLMTNPVSGQITRNEAEVLLWRWEFLRRLPEYQRDYKSFKNDRSARRKEDIRLKYGIVNPHNPQELCPADLYFDDNRPLVSPPFISYTINLSLGTKRLLADFEQRVRAYKNAYSIRGSRIPSSDKYPQFLRVLDALAAAPQQEWQKLLFPGTRAKNAIAKKILRIKQAQILLAMYTPSATAPVN